MSIKMCYNTKSKTFCKPLNGKKTIRRLKPPNDYKEGQKMIWVVLLIVFVLGFAIGGIVIGILEYREGYKDGYEKGGWGTIDLC